MSQNPYLNESGQYDPDDIPSFDEIAQSRDFNPYAAAPAPQGMLTAPTYVSAPYTSPSALQAVSLLGPLESETYIASDGQTYSDYAAQQRNAFRKILQRAKGRTTYRDQGLDPNMDLYVEFPPHKRSEATYWERMLHPLNPDTFPLTCPPQSHPMPNNWHELPEPYTGCAGPWGMQLPDNALFIAPTNVREDALTMGWQYLKGRTSFNDWRQWPDTGDFTLWEQVVLDRHFAKRIYQISECLPLRPAYFYIARNYFTICYTHAVLTPRDLLKDFEWAWQHNQVDAAERQELKKAYDTRKGEAVVKESKSAYHLWTEACAERNRNIQEASQRYVKAVADRQQKIREVEEKYRPRIEQLKASITELETEMDMELEPFNEEFRNAKLASSIAKSTKLPPRPK